MRAEPFTTYLWWDVLRVVMLVVALLLLAFTAKMLWWRITSPEADGVRQTHPASIISYMVALVAIAAWRMARLGHPPNEDMITALLVLATGVYGAWHHVRIPARKGR
jgi:hypothetical protein